MTYSKVIGTGSYLPDKILTNKELEQQVDTTDEWIMKRVGIRERRLIADSGDTTVSMAVAAAKNALNSANIKPEHIDMIVVGTASADCYFPSVACLVQQQLGIENECGAVDVNAACAGFIYAVSMADQYIRNNEIKTALVIGVDALSTVVDWTDRRTCVLFGDGAGAVVLQANDAPGVITSITKAAGKYSQLLYSNSALWDRGQSDFDAGKLRMQGHEVFKVAVTKLGEIVQDVLDKAGLKQSDIDWLIPHQANLRIITATAKKLNLSMDHVVLTIERHGNTSAASIPLALDEAVRCGKVKPGQIVLLEAFGAGFAWGATLLKY